MDIEKRCTTAPILQAAHPCHQEKNMKETTTALLTGILRNWRLQALPLDHKAIKIKRMNWRLEQIIK